MTLKLLAETYLLLRSRSSWVPGGCPSQCRASRVDGGFTLSWQPCSSLYDALRPSPLSVSVSHPHLSASHLLRDAMSLHFVFGEFFYLGDPTLLLITSKWSDHTDSWHKHCTRVTNVEKIPVSVENAAPQNTMHFLLTPFLCHWCVFVWRQEMRSCKMHQQTQK